MSKYRFIVGVAWGVIALLTAVAVLRLFAHDTALPLIVLNAFTEWLYLPLLPILLLAWRLRLRRLFALSSLLIALYVAWIWPGVPPLATRHTPSVQRLRLMSANLLMVNTQTVAMVKEIQRTHPDILLVQELAPQWSTAFATAPMQAMFPFRREVVRRDSFGIGVYSRSPIHVTVFEMQGLPQMKVDLVAKGQRLRFYNLHTLPPRTTAYTPIWKSMMQNLHNRLQKESGPLLVVGDLNATRHAYGYQRLISLGLRDAHQERGRGLATTWPNGIFPLPPIRLDHVLVSRELAVTQISEGRGTGSDHRPVIADVALR